MVLAETAINTGVWRRYLTGRFLDMRVLVLRKIDYLYISFPLNLIPQDETRFVQCLK
jgi:hypothetical protein